MPQFRLCSVMADGRIATDHCLTVETEAEALACTFDYLDDQPTIELWCDTQRVARFDQTVLRTAG